MFRTWLVPMSLQVHGTSVSYMDAYILVPGFAGALRKVRSMQCKSESAKADSLLVLRKGLPPVPLPRVLSFVDNEVG